MDGIEWKQYNQPAIAEKVKKPKKSLNSASISVFTRSLMAREWARALGKRPVQLKPKKDGLNGSR